MKTTLDLNNEWRMVASAIYKRPTDSKILGQSEVDVTDLEAYIAQKPDNFDPKKYLAAGRDAVMARTIELIRLCGSEGKA